MPAGVIVYTNNSDSSVLASSLTLSSNAPLGSMLSAKFVNGILTIGIITGQGSITGNFAVLNCNIPAGTTAPDASAFTVKNLKISDVNGVSITGGTVTMN